MLFHTAVGLVALASHVLAREMAVNPATEPSYASGAVMQKIMEKKEATFARQRASGASGNSAQYPKVDNPVPCIDGLATAIPGNANYTFRCSKVRSSRMD